MEKPYLQILSELGCDWYPGDMPTEKELKADYDKISKGKKPVKKRGKNKK